MAVSPGDLSLNWEPETELLVVPIDEEVGSRALTSGGARDTGWRKLVRQRSEIRITRPDWRVTIPCCPLKVAS